MQKLRYFKVRIIDAVIDWFKVNFLPIKRSEVHKLCINKELRKFGLSVSTVNPKADNILWCDRYYFETEKEYERWRKYCLKVISKALKIPKDSKAAEDALSWLDMGYGLRRNIKNTK